MLTEPLQITYQVVQALEALRIRYLIGGSLATAIHGFVRATLDADIVADIGPEHVFPLRDLLKDHFYVDTEMILDAIIHQGSFNLLHSATFFKVDIFILKQRAFDLNQMDRRILQEVGDTAMERAYFSTAEDIVLAKLEWFRQGGETSERQWRDILGVLDLQSGQLDFEYLRHWAGRLGIADLLERAERDAK